MTIVVRHAGFGLVQDPRQICFYIIQASNEAVRVSSPRNEGVDQVATLVLSGQAKIRSPFPQGNKSKRIPIVSALKLSHMPVANVAEVYGFPHIKAK